MSKHYLIVDPETAEVVKESPQAISVLLLKALHQRAADYLRTGAKQERDALQKQVTATTAQLAHIEKK